MRTDPVHLGPEDDWESSEQPDLLEYADPAYLGDRHFYRVIGWGLVVIVGLTVIGSIGLAAYNKDIPEALVAIGSAAIGIGALASVLTINRH